VALETLRASPMDMDYALADLLSLHRVAPRSGRALRRSVAAARR
jgi:hypothetical protein